MEARFWDGVGLVASDQADPRRTSNGGQGYYEHGACEAAMLRSGPFRGWLFDGALHKSTSRGDRIPPRSVLVPDESAREAQVLPRFFEVRLDAKSFLVVGNGRIVFAVTAKDVRKFFVSDLKVGVH